MCFEHFSMFNIVEIITTFDSLKDIEAIYFVEKTDKHIIVHMKI